MTKLTGWGKYPYIESSVFSPDVESVPDCPAVERIPRGMGRSYGDSALASSVITSNNMNRFIAFNENSGVLHCEAGVSLADILEVFVPKGWFLMVTPGTKFVSVGGAIACDVHGKNHHIDGCFSECVESLTLCVGGQYISCSKNECADLFYASCGGMGLTGMIVEATIKLRRITSAYVAQKTIKARNLQTALALFDAHEGYTYSVAWIDCLATGANLGRSLMMLGEHAEHGELDVHKKSRLSVPCDMPASLLNTRTVSAFNYLYYHRVRQAESDQIVHYEPFFYPLDGIHHWNRLYGGNGFTQYQFVIPKEAGLEGLSEILTIIAESKQGSFLSVLKVLGEGNKNLLSFPCAGYTLAFDFKITPTLFPLLDKLDTVVAHFGGRLYLAKDVRMSEAMFKASYSRWEMFQKVRKKYGVDKLFASLQSKRIGL